MARMSIDDSITRDPEFDHLAELVGWHRREAVGCMIEIWAICYDRVTPNIPPRDIETAARRGARVQPAHPNGFVAALIECGLARPATKNDLVFTKKDGAVLPWKDQQWRDRIHISGASKRIGYLLTQSEAGHRGGVNSGKSRRNQDEGSLKGRSSTLRSEPQGSTNPSASASASASVPDPVLPSASVPDHSEKNSAAPSAGGSRSKRPRPSEPTAEERASALFILRKLTDRSGVRYSGTAEHLRLIVGRLRDGYTEADLRKVIGYCAVELEWQDNPDMAKYLRPETLFGPKTISKYLDAARDWFMKQGLDLEPRPLLEVVQ